MGLPLLPQAEGRGRWRGEASGGHLVRLREHAPRSVRPERERRGRAREVRWLRDILPISVHFISGMET